MPKPILLISIGIFTLLLAACSAATPPTAVPTPAPTDQITDIAAADLSPDAAAGLEIYRAVGCAGCHGQDGEGNIGPALAGHTQEQLFRQVRAPKGDIMPPFPEDRLSDDDVEKIGAWIDTLGEEMVMEHGEEGTADSLELSMTEADHLRLILDSLAAGNQDDATHHAQHLVGDASPAVLPLAEKLLADLQAGDIHAAEAETSEALGARASAAFEPVSVHLGMALSAAQRDDTADVEHHLESAVLAAANHNHQPEMQRLLDDWRQGDDPHGVIDRMYESLKLDHQD